MTSLSKFLSLVLRHKPETIGLLLDKQGWANVIELIERVNEHGHSLDFQTLEGIVADNNKQRFTFNDDQTQIRANQGHSIQVDLELEPTTPPALLYHGTATRFVNSIRQQGLLKNNRQHVHLSADTETARNVGIRHGVPHILTIQAEKMHQAGYQFFISKNGVWLTDKVPVQFIDF